MQYKKKQKITYNKLKNSNLLYNTVFENESVNCIFGKCKKIVPFLNKLSILYNKKVKLIQIYKYYLINFKKILVDYIQKYHCNDLYFVESFYKNFSYDIML